MKHKAGGFFCRKQRRPADAQDFSPESSHFSFTESLLFRQMQKRIDTIFQNMLRYGCIGSGICPEAAE